MKKKKYVMYTYIQMHDRDLMNIMTILVQVKIKH